MLQFIKKNGVLLLFFVAALAVLLLSLYTSNLMESSANMLEYSTVQRLSVLSRMAATIVTAEELEQIHTAEDIDTPAYKELKQRVKTFNDEWSLLYTYFLRETDGQLQYIVDNEMDYSIMDGPDSFIDMYDAPEWTLRTGEVSISGMGDYLDEWDLVMASYAPVFDAKGEIYCVVGVDIIDEQIINLNGRIRVLNIAQIISLLVAAATGIIGVLLYRKKAQSSESASIAKSEFLSNMSHEIRTPLNAILGMTTIGKAAGNIEKKDYAFSRIETSSAHLLNVINDILDMSKIEAKKFELSPVPFRFEEMVQRVADINRYRIDERHQRFIVTLDENIPNTLVGDDQRLAQVITNLLSNAVKFTPDGGDLRLDVQVEEQRDGMCTLLTKVTDTGIGLSAEQQAKLFNSFQQAESSTSRKYGGTGLGLAISKQIVEMMGGNIWVESEQGHGACFLFRVMLTIADDMESVADMSADGLVENEFAGKCILLTEDIEINREIVRTLIEPTGVEVVDAVDGHDAVQKFAADPEKYDIIFMDVQMPGLDGYGATRQIRAMEHERAKSISIIAMTANVFKDDIDRCIDAGMNAHIGKPIDLGQVLEKLRMYLRV